jgi:hypothetical protein
MKSHCIDIIKSMGNVSLSYILSTTISLAPVCVSNGPFVALLSVIEFEASLAIKVQIVSDLLQTVRKNSRSATVPFRKLGDCKAEMLDELE